MNKYDSTTRYITALSRKQRRLRDKQSASVSVGGGGSAPLSGVVTTTGDQNIFGVKHFEDGFSIGGIRFYRSQDGTVYVEGNLVTSGGITARGANTTTTPSLFEALPIDSRTIKRDANGVLYVDVTALNISGGGGVADSISWKNVTGKPTWIGSTKPTYTPKEIGALGVQDTALNSLSLGGYTHDNYLRWESSGGVPVDLNQVFNFSVKSVQNGAMNYPSASPYGVLLSLPYRNASGNTIPYYGTQLFFACGDDALPNAYWRDSYGSEYKNWRTFLDSSNYSNYALPITGGTVNGNLLVTGGITARYTSDRRLKQNIRPFRASETLMSLGGVYQFEYMLSEVEKNHIYGGSHIGLIYQNVVGSALNRMCYKGEDGYGSLNYLEPSFISLIAGATMENVDEITKLKKENRALKERVEQLERRA